ncbi:DUF6673 family protein [Amedibacillus dolichus]|jgi:hypothetical protein|uniref:DUF6673 domain-containing protein n=1 Tax=Amedibacillus dolichus DSM 3991 TaxID=428127 RepID=A8RBY6_9FIRM|nr:DUF6673 family protein [Amedibacillus dolichus]EDP11297.1 hypothetical protein EUBDOL_01217 [Amedibacillus dolichus DSM 3991]
MSQFKIPQWEVNGMKLPFDFDDADTMDRYMEAIMQLQEDAKNIATEGTRADEIRSYCALFDKMYDHIFGAGTADKIFEGRKNIRLYDKTYDDFIGFVKRCRMQTQQAMMNKVNKYSGKRNQQKRNFH